MPSITINYQDFNKGVSVSDFLPTGGFSPKDKGHNLHATPGVLNSQPAVIDNGSCKDIIAWTNKQGGTDADIVALGIDNSNDDGFIYSFSSTGVPTQKGTDNGRNYKKAFLILFSLRVIITPLLILILLRLTALCLLSTTLGGLPLKARRLSLLALPTIYWFLRILCILQMATS